MIIEYTGRHTEVTDKLKAQAQAGIGRIAEIAHGPERAHVILTEDKYRRMAEVVISGRGGEQLVANGEAKDMEVALHDALHKAEQQAAKHKDKWVKLTQHPAFAGRVVDEPTPEA